MSSPTPLLNVSVAVPIDGVIKNMQTKPQAQWYVFCKFHIMNQKLK